MPACCILEYGAIQRGILNRIGLGYLSAGISSSPEENARISDWRHISAKLIDKTMNRYLSLLIYVIFHLSFLTTTSKTISLVLVLGYVFILFQKLFVFNAYLNELQQLAD